VNNPDRAIKQRFTIALAGNPNAGKTTVFNAITGARQHIANYPGVTVEKKVGKVLHKGYEIEVVDLPGTYSLTAYSLEELVARRFLVEEKPDLVVNIVDASNLDRNLYLAVQLMELGVPLVIALNMMDVAEVRGILVDPQVLSGLLGVPVVPMVARSNKGVKELLDAVVAASEGDRGWRPLVISYGMDIDQGLKEIEEIINSSQIYDRKYPPGWRALKCMEGDGPILDLLKRDPPLGERIEIICQNIRTHVLDTLDEEPEGIIADHRYGFIAGITRKTVRRKIESRLNLSDKIDRVLTGRILGPVIMILVLYLIYLFTFSASQVPIQWVEIFFDGLKGVMTSILPEGNLRSLIVSGVIDGVGGVLGFVPLIVFMFFTIAIMEDSGYMARVAYMLDRVLRSFGLHGNSVMALIVSGGIAGGCAVPGVLATRTLRDPKERFATLLVVPFMNCGAKLPVFAMLIGAFFSDNQARMMFVLTLLSWGFALFSAKILRSTVLRGPKTPFVMELPPYRVPTLRGLLIHTWERTWYYVKKAGTVILGFSVILWAMMTFPGLSKEERRAFEREQKQAAVTFLSHPAVNEWVHDERELADLNDRFERQGIKSAGTRDVGQDVMLAVGKPSPLDDLVAAALHMEGKGQPVKELDKETLEAAGLYVAFRQEMADKEIQMQQAAIKATVAGWFGQALEPLTRPLGFDYRINVALVGGFAAKEVVVSTLGTAYSLGDVDPHATGSLSERLAKDPTWTPLLAFTLIIFTMLYVPCFVTLISIRRETSWMWAGFSMGYNLAAAYLVALIIMQVGLALGLGV
jgi:ferrous iron transport protein B